MTTPDDKPCQLHYGPSPDGRYGLLVDPNGHGWKICSDCINSLWLEKQALNQSDEPAKAGLESMVKLAREIDCECTLCLTVKLGAEIAGYHED